MSHLARLAATLAVLLAPVAAADTTAFGPGEQVVYRASYLGISAGTVEMTVGAEFPEQPGVWPILGLGRSDIALFFYPLHDKLVIHWDAEHSRSLGMEMWADENHKREHLKISFDPAEPKATVYSQREGQALYQQEFAVEPGSVDVASAIYLLRTMPLEPGTEFQVPVMMRRNQFSMHVAVERRERISTPLGEKAAVRVRLATAFGGKLAQQRDFILYFTDDETHLPLRMEAEMGIGSIVAEAVEYHSGLRLPARPKAAARTGVH